MLHVDACYGSEKACVTPQIYMRQGNTMQIGNFQFYHKRSTFVVVELLTVELLSHNM